ncbi:MAG: hypothetical protein FWD47_13730 [Treponema sp.]|nr:hypothetical protein [Treponema sp.]
MNEEYMKIDHLVINVNKQYQIDKTIINKIKDNGFPYEPKWGKGTFGFKATNLWIGNEYFEMIRILKKNGGGWRKEWVEMYNNHHRGLICLFIETNNIKNEYERLNKIGINISKPEYLKFKWFFNLLTRTMPWQNTYFPFFQGIPLQLGFQQMKDGESKKWMQQYMVPNSIENEILGIKKINIFGNYSEDDKSLIKSIFQNAIIEENKIIVELINEQKLVFIQNDTYYVEVFTQCNNKIFKEKKINIQNIKIIND